MHLFYDIYQVKEITSQNYFDGAGLGAVDKVNELLSQGWILLKIYTTCYDYKVAPQQQIIHYVLGIDKGTKQANEDWDNGLIPGPPQNE